MPARSVRLGLVGLLPLALFLLGQLAVAASLPPAAPMLERLVVGLAPGADPAALAPLLAETGGWVEAWLPAMGLAKISAPAGQAGRAAVVLAGRPEVDFVTESRPSMRAAEAPRDEYWDQQWGPARVAAPAAWDIAWTHPSVVIAVIDSGVDAGHADLAPARWINPGESAPDPVTGQRTCDAAIAHNGIDDDVNGYVDDCAGYDFIIRTGDPVDGHGHGTFVAGIAAAAVDNLDPDRGVYEGMAGMAHGGRLMALRTLNNAGAGYPADIAEAIAYAVANGAQILNLSLTLPVVNPNPYDVEILRRAVVAAQAAGAVIVAATGNDYYSTVAYPARFDGVVSVGASTQADTRASFSNYGARLDLLAPGTGIFSTLADAPRAYGLYRGSGNGTSFAAPHVAGAAALVRSLRPDLSPAAVRELLLASADDLDAAGFDQQTGWGRLNTGRAALLATAGLAVRLSAEPASIPVAGETALRIRIEEISRVQPAGFGAQVRLETSGGAVTPTLVTVDGMGQAAVRFSALRAIGAVWVTATVGAVSAAVPISISSGLPATMSLVAAPARLGVGGHAATVTAIVRDEADSAVIDGISVTFTSTLGALSPLNALTVGGRATTTLTTGAITGTALIQAAAGAITAATTVEVVGVGQPFHLALAAAPDVLWVGEAPAVLTATVSDALGDPVPDGVGVQFLSDLGEIGPAAGLTSGGIVTATLQPGHIPGPAHVRGTAEGVQGEAVITILPGPAAALTATLTPAELTAGYGQIAQLHVAAADRFGNSVADGALLSFETSLGRVTPAQQATVGGAAQVSFVGELVAGMAAITVTAPGGAAAYVQALIRPARLSSLALDLAAAEVEAGGSPVTATAVARDDYGNRAEAGTPVTFTTDLGGWRPAGSADAPRAALVVATTDVATVEWVPGVTAGRARLRAAVEPGLRAERSAQVAPGPPAGISLTAQPPRLPVGRSAVVMAFVHDRFDNAVADGTLVRFAAGRGSFSMKEAPTKDGAVTVYYTADHQLGPVSLVAISNGASMFSSVEVIPLGIYLPMAWR